MKLNFFITAIAATCVRSSELETLKVCSETDFRIFCDFNSILAIHQAIFTTDPTKVNGFCRYSEINCTEDIRFDVSSRCSGLSQCHLNFTNDHPEKKCPGHGVITIKYACVPETSINKYCNVHLVSSSGYIMSPGYPKFYPRLYNCTWFVQANEGQRIELSFLDVSVRLAEDRDRCQDVIRVTEGNRRVLIGCGLSDDNLLRSVTSKGNKLKIRLASNVFIPSKGFLIYYKAKGCTRLPSPEFGYMVYNNGTSALYMCCKDHAFNDTGTDSRYLHCINDQNWNASLPSCIPVGDNHSRLISRLFLNDEYYTREELLTHKVYLEDILVPITLMVVLLLGNAIVIYFVVKIRRKRKNKQAHSEMENLRNLSSQSTTV